MNWAFERLPVGLFFRSQPSLRAQRSNPFLGWARHGLLRGACHRARIRATRWLAMTSEIQIEPQAN
jgi:hypothetical protein